MKTKKVLSLVLSLVLAAQLCLPVSAVDTVGESGNTAYSENMLSARIVNISNGDVSIGFPSSSPCPSPCQGHVITGSSTEYAIKIWGGHHKITLFNADIQNNNYTSAFSLLNGATVELTLLGTNTLKGYKNYAGLAVRKGNKLTITKESTGTLNATGGHYGAGIGGDYASSEICQPGTIIIDGGVVNATGGYEAAGIGGGYYCSGGDITINGGKVTAKGSEYGAGIGGGIYGTGGYVDINGGEVEATCTGYAAGIGGGYKGDSGHINIYGGKVTAKSGGIGSYGGPGIGCGKKAPGNKTDNYITIRGGDVTATGGVGGAGIGGCYEAGAVYILIAGGKVNAKGGYGPIGYGPGIGGGIWCGGGTEVNITGGEVTATSVKNSPGIGSGTQSGDITINISGGTVVANGGENSAGIGSGDFSTGSDIVNITGGTVTATGGKDGTGIGSGSHSTGGKVNITGGTVTATGNDWASGIGGSLDTKGNTVTIDGDAVIFAKRGSSSADHIGNGVDAGTTAVVNRNRGIVFEGDSDNFYGSDVTLWDNATLPAGKNLTIPNGKTLIIPDGKTLTNNANLFLDGGRITGTGKINGNGSFKTTILSEDILDISDQMYTGKEIIPLVSVNPTRKIFEKDFKVTSDGFTRSFQNNTEIGKAKVLYTKGLQKAEKNFNIVLPGTAFEGGIKTYNGTTEMSIFTYGDIITVKAKPKATGTAANMAAPAPNQMALYMRDTQICEPVDPDSDGVYTMKYDTTNKKVSPPSVRITAKYVGNSTMADATEDVYLILLPKLLTATTDNSFSREYDKSTGFIEVPLTLDGVESGDSVTATANGNAANANVGTHAFTASSAILGGVHSCFYTLAPTAVSGSVRIAPKPVTVDMTAANKVYDGTTDALSAYTVVGTLGSDYITASGTATFEDKGVGTDKAVTARDITLQGSEVSNYSLNEKSPVTTKASITAKDLIWGEGGTVQNKPYDGTKTATVATNPVPVGVILNDTVTVEGGSATFASAKVGTHSIAATDFSIGGADAANYTAPTGQPIFADGTITLNNVENPIVTVNGSYTFNGNQIKPDADNIKVTDGSNPIAASDYTVTYGENVNAGIGAGIVTVTLRGNYSGSGSAIFDIAKATTSNPAVPEPISMTAGSKEEYSIPLPTISSAGKVTYSVSSPTDASIFGQTPTVDGENLKFTCADSATEGKNTEVVITVVSDNYNDFNVTLTFVVTSKTTVAITGLTAADGIYSGNSHSGFDGTISVEGNNVPPEQLVYSYTGIGDTTYTESSNPPTNAGSYKLTISVPTSNNNFTGSHAVITFKITKAPITVKQGGYTIDKIWDDTTSATGSGSVELTVTSGAPIGEVTVTPTPHDYPSSNVSTSHSVIVDLTLNDNSGNYTLAENTLTAIGTITKSNSSPAAPSAPIAMTILDTSITLQTLLSDGETVEYGKNDNGTGTISWQELPSFTGLSPNTTYHFFARVKENTNHATGTESQGTPITTEKKKSPVIAPKGLVFPVGKAWAGNFTVSELLGEWEGLTGSRLPSDATFVNISGPSTADLVVLDSLEISSGKLEFKSKNNLSVPDKEDVFIVTVRFDKYQDVTFPLSFRNSEKFAALITATLENKVYDGKAVVLPTPTATSAGAPATLNYSYTWHKDGTVIGEAPKDAGNYALVITGENDNSVGSLRIPFVIEKRPLTVTARSENILAGTDAPEYTITPSGLAENETLSEVTITCGYKNDGSVSSIVGRYPITPSGGTVSGGNDNYAIAYLSGTLSVTMDTTALDEAIKAANTAKSEISISDNDQSQVENGTRFVSTDVMAALNAALADAEEVRAKATTNEQIVSATVALTNATKIFIAAIQTGSYIPSSGGGGGGNSGVTMYSIITRPGEGGSISPEGTVKVKRGTDKVFTITPNNGYIIADVQMDGVSVGAVDSYTFTNVRNVHTISATFRKLVNSYSDVTEEDWFYDDVQAVTQRLLMGGVGDQLFDPYGTATRGVIVTVLYRQAGSPVVETNETKWYSPARAWAMKVGISDGTDMESEITRQEIVTMLYRYAKLSGIDVSVGEDTNILSFNDAFDLPTWSIPAFQWACGAGIVQGADGYLLPTVTATRAEVAALLERFVGLITK